MTEQKQIEEIKAVLVRTCKRTRTMQEDYMQDRYAKDLYTAGYRKQGEARWKGAGLGDYSCSLCGATYSGGNEYNFCPNCGARMKGDEVK